MDLLKGNVRKIFFRYLTASFGSALIVAIYSIVDCAMVGQYEGPEGIAALATVMPIWNIVLSLGLLFGIGGAVLMSAARGSGDKARGDSIFTTALICTLVIAIIVWLVIIFFDSQLLRLFGADDELLVLARRYVFYIKFAVPLFVIGQFLAAFLRNDNAPGKATVAVISGGIFNIIGDYIFVFTFDMGIDGAGLATAMAQVLTLSILLSHFFSKKCTLTLRAPERFFFYTKAIVATGFATFFIDIAMGILSMMFNNQIMTYCGTDALAVYGVIVNINLLVQSCAYGVGQAAQPIISINYGAQQVPRIMETFRWSLITTAVFSVLWTVLSIGFPIMWVKLFMAPTPEVLAIAPMIMSMYFISFLLLPFNIFSTYYFQAIMKPKASFAVSVLRGIVVSGILIYSLPVIFGGDAIWVAMPITELIIAIGVILFMRKYNRELKEKMLPL